MKRKIESKIVYSIVVFRSFALNLMAATLPIFLLGKGINFIQLNSLDSVMLISGLLLEIPTGVIGDKFGHKASFQTSMLLQILYYLLLIVTDSYVALMCITLIHALSDACWSGSFITWYMKKLCLENSDSEHIKLFSHIAIITSCVGIFAGFMGAQISNISMAVGLGLSAITMFLALVLSFFVSTGEEQEKEDHTSLRIILQASKEFFLSNRRVRNFLISLFLLYIAVSGIDNFWSPYVLSLSDTGNLGYLSYTWVLIRIGTLCAGFITKKMSSSRMGYRFLWISSFFSAVSLFGMVFCQDWISASILFAFHAMNIVVVTTLANGYMYRNIPEQSKATVLSALSMLFSISGIIGLTLLGYIADRSLSFAFLGASMVMVIVAIALLFKRFEYESI